MSNLRAEVRGMVAVAVVLLVAAPALWAQETLTAKLDPSGLVRIVAGDVEVATLDLNVHGLQWAHASQSTATAKVSDLPDGAGQRFVGTLPIPSPPGTPAATPAPGALTFTETVTTLPLGLRVKYDLGFSQALKLNGLQVSVNLPVARYGGQTVTVGGLDQEPQVVTLPAAATPDLVQLWAGAGSKFEVAKGTPQALTIELLASGDAVVQDLRKWEQPTFEIRFPAILDDAGRDVAADDRLHFELNLIFPTPVKLVGP